jgi:hypothetical protein
MTWILLPSGTMLNEEEIASIRPRMAGANQEYECILKNVPIAGAGGGASPGGGRFECASIMIDHADYTELKRILQPIT